MKSWNEILAPYRKPHHGLAIGQLVTTGGLFFLLWTAMFFSLESSYLLTLALAVPTSLLLVRLFIIQHDCSHGSFFRSRLANDTVGSVIGVLTLTPYHYWRRTHALHHATSGNLDERGFGEVNTLTVNEYKSLSRGRRAWYRIYRSSFVLFVIGPAYQFIFKHRLPVDAPRAWKREWASVMLTNVALVAIVVAFAYTVGLGKFLMVQLPVSMISGSFGVWLFYVQHQFEDTYWDHKKEFDFEAACLEGCSYYDLPKVLHWFTGNIGYHHIHHLASLIPNYRLAKCMREVKALQKARRLTLWKSFHCARLTLWDESTRRLVGFAHLKTQST